jgi:broad specificity phosphatase PhoE
MKLYLCRHGETEWTLSGRHTGRTDLDLTENGRLQAEKLQQRLEGVSFEKVFCSPKKRALQTAEGLDYEIDPDLVEIDYGEYEGFTTEHIHKKNPAWNLFQSGSPRGETLAMAGERADRFLAKVADFKGNVAVFSHGHFLRILAARFLQLEPAQGKIFTLSVASVSILGFEREQPAVICWNVV